MVKNITIISKNLISIELINKQDLESFIKIFTVLDKHIAAKTLFMEEVRIEYKQHNCIEVVELIKGTGFTYNDVENVLNHLNKHGIKVPNSVIANSAAKRRSRSKRHSICQWMYAIALCVQRSRS